MNTGDLMAEVEFNNLLAQAITLAMMVGLAQGIESPQVHREYLPATVEKSPEIDLTGIKKPAKISSIEPLSLPPHLRRQRDRYISRWTEAMFRTE